MLADLDQFRRDDSHGTIVGGKRFIDLRHSAADGGTFLHEIDIVAGIGHIQSCLHPGNTSADNQYGTYRLIRHVFLLCLQTDFRQIGTEIHSLIFTQTSQSKAEYGPEMNAMKPSLIKLRQVVNLRMTIVARCDTVSCAGIQYLFYLEFSVGAALINKT